MRKGAGPTGAFFGDIIEQIYEAASDPGRWPGIMNAIADCVGADSSHLMVFDPRSGTELLGFLERQDPEVLRLYMEDYLATDIRVPRMLDAEIGAILGDRDLWSEDEKDASPLYHDYQLKYRLHEITGANLSLGERWIWFGFSRADSALFAPRELRFMKRLMPHVRQSLRLHLELADRSLERDLLADLWSRRGKAVMLLDARGRLKFHNNRADEWMTQGTIVVRSGKLAFNDRRASAALARMTTRDTDPIEADDDPGAGALLRDSATGEQLGVRFMRMLGGDNGAFDNDRLVVTITPLRQTSVSPGEIRRFAGLFGLSNVEQKIAAAVAAGENIGAFAASRNVKIDTARKQLKSTLMKTGSRSQKDLVRLIERYCFLNTK